MFAIFIGFGGSKKRGCIKAIIWGGNANHKVGAQFLWGRRVLIMYWKFIASLTGVCKRFSKIPLFTTLLLFYLSCIYWDRKGQKRNLKCPKATSMRLILDYSACTVISACTHPCDTNAFIQNVTRILQPKIHNIWMEFFWNLNPKVIYILFLIKMSADISDTSFLRDSLW